MKYILPKNSLIELPKDRRDFSLGAVGGISDLLELPTGNFVVAKPILIKDQGDSDLCSAYAVTAVSEDQEGIELLPEYQFLKTKELSGNPEEWGANLRDACKSAVKFGSLEVPGFGFLKGISREQIFSKNTFPLEAELTASLHKKRSYFSVDGPYDTFDNIRAALWKNRGEKCSIVTGVLWRNDWIDAESGIIPNKYGSYGFGHAFKIFGQKTINGEMYLVAQLSQGIEVGDGGIFYFNREVTNREIGKYGIFMFLDLDRNTAENILKNKGKFVGTNIFIKIWSFIRKLFFETHL